MNETEIRRLEVELNATLEKFSATGKFRLEKNQSIVDKTVREIVEIYSNDIRNLSIISGTIAPFSLTLLQIEKLNTNAPSLILGFSILLLNIILAQFLIKKQLKDKDTASVRAQIHIFFAEQALKESTDPSIPTTQRVSKNFDYIKEIDEVERLLGLSTMDVAIQDLRSKLRKFNKLLNTLFAFGAFCIVLSVIINPVIEWILNFC